MVAAVVENRAELNPGSDHVTSAQGRRRIGRRRCV
jgi:hypothetical protein